MWSSYIQAAMAFLEEESVLTLYTDESCGIDVPHRHSGDLVQGHFVEYWCPTLSAWVSEKTRESYGNSCKCTHRHMKARVQSVVTETIYILPIKNDLEAYLWEEISKALNKHWDEEIDKFLNGDTNVEPDVCDSDVRDRESDTPPGLSEG